MVKICKEYTSYYRKLATKTVYIQQEELHDHWGQAWDKPHQQQVQWHEQRHAQDAQHLSMHWERVVFVTLWCWVTCTIWLKFWVPSPLSLSTSICPSPSSPTSSSSCTSSSTLSSTTWSPCKTCAPPRTRGVTTPTTSTPPSQVMSPTTCSSASSATPRVPSPTLPSHRTWTLTTLHSASCSPRHTEDKPITAIRKACQSVSRHCLSCSIEQGNLWEKDMSISQLVLVSRETRTVLTASFLKTPKLRKWLVVQGNLRRKQLKCRD